MLIACPECKKQISDKAVFCPNCGYPINSAPVVVEKQNGAKSERTRASKRQHLKLPNGFGSIQYLGGNRRNPYAAYPPRKKSDYDDDGKCKVKALGYFATWYDAYDFLADYNGKGNSSTTFSEVYDRWLTEKQNNPRRKFSTSTFTNYAWAYSFCEELYDVPMSSIHRDDMQKIVDRNSNKSYSCQNALKKLWGQMFAYAIQNGITDTNYAKYVELKQNDEVKGLPLTEEELKRLWEHKDNKDVQIALILVYSGLRVSELKKTTIDLEKRQFRGGVKTTAGKERIVPIHNKVYDFVVNFDQASYSPVSYTSYHFGIVKNLCGITDEKRCSPHSCRHTFSWLWDKYVIPADDTAKHLVMGHSLGTDVEVNTYGHRTDEQLAKLVNMIQ